MEFTFKTYSPAEVARISFDKCEYSSTKECVRFDDSIVPECRNEHFKRFFAPPILCGVDFALKIHSTIESQCPQCLRLTGFEIWNGGTTRNGIECAAAGAAWLTLGHPASNLEIKRQSGLWRIFILGNWH